jgi:hypothetical protein
MSRVFISYSHDSDEHKARVHALADRLRSNGVTVLLDRDMLPGGPGEGWPQWSERQVKEADQVLVVCTAIYSERYEGNQPPGGGLGAACEASAIRQLIYNQAGFNEKIRVVLFDITDQAHVPLQLQRYHAFQPLTDAGYAEILAWLRGPQPVPEPQRPQPLAICWPSLISGYPWPLADRMDEFAFFGKMVTGQLPQRILLLRGISNTGKTVLLTELVAYARRLQLPAVFLDFKGCPLLDDLFEMLRLDLGQGILRHAYAATGTGRFFQLISDLQQLSAPLLLVFDTYEQASADAQKWLESQLLPRLDRAPGVLVIIGGQRIPEYGVTGGNPGQVSALLETLVQGLQADRNG